MNDCISREDVKEYLKRVIFGADQKIDRWIDAIPAADVRPVVLCKDCRHRDPEDHKCDCGLLERVGCVFQVDDNYWCAHGEKGETNENFYRKRF